MLVVRQNPVALADCFTICSLNLRSLQGTLFLGESPPHAPSIHSQDGARDVLEKYL
jgi:hypothetical protein